MWPSPIFANSTLTSASTTAFQLLDQPNVHRRPACHVEFSHGLQTSGKETTGDFVMSISHVQFKRVQNSTTGTINDLRPAPSTIDGTDKKWTLARIRFMQFEIVAWASLNTLASA
ncbi:hypothetical protein K435DRAFT_797593 [Dendrothele bispora CBS 962.96]|uniref:Uncharacterized protein n=1 Tax=Dendrothele bispora (strain CBS 962.96) TaxID=1314807 RepID=A0A4S8M331_DENBC|nr:hypothetical protein K435DRAFT_797593 [Dendrothele bispora CBS 962.96]